MYILYICIVHCEWHNELKKSREKIERLSPEIEVKNPKSKKTTTEQTTTHTQKIK